MRQVPVNSDRFLTEKLPILLSEKQFKPALRALHERKRSVNGQLKHLLHLSVACLKLVHLLNEVA